MRKYKFDPKKLSECPSLKTVDMNSESISKDIFNNWKSSYLPNVEIINIDQMGYLWGFIEDNKSNHFYSKDAVNEYRKQKAINLIVMPDPGRYDLCTFYCQIEELPYFSGDDILVFPKNFAWTMVFTHEDFKLWYGPVFIMHKNYMKLSQKNIEAVKEKGRLI